MFNDYVFKLNVQKHLRFLFWRRGVFLIVPVVQTIQGLTLKAFPLRRLLNQQEIIYHSRTHGTALKANLSQGLGHFRACQSVTVWNIDGFGPRWAAPQCLERWNHKM